MLQLIENPPARLGPDPVAARDHRSTLAAAFRDGRVRIDADPAARSWRRVHHGYFWHLKTPASAAFDAGPYPKAGGDSTSMMAMYRYRPSDFRVCFGSSVRLVMEVGYWNNSR
jgi:penicillin amidase